MTTQFPFWRWWWVIFLGVLGLALVLFWFKWVTWALLGAQPLKMVGGDPYLRALMRTISVTESNYDNPYHVMFGGQMIETLDRHPNTCQPITKGPNRGNCSTAAGRYQLLYSTWEELARKYHVHPPTPWRFEPIDQDEVVYAWLSDKQFWGQNLAEQLKKGKIHIVLKRLSSTWTSLGYGIESNKLSSSLPEIYKELVKQELETQH